MKLEGAGRSLMVAGVACIIIYILVSLSELSANAMRIGKLLFYVGVVITVIGVALRLSRSTPGS